MCMSWPLNYRCRDISYVFIPKLPLNCPQEIRNQSHECPYKVAKYPENRNRNRYRDVSPCKLNFKLHMSFLCHLLAPNVAMDIVYSILKFGPTLFQSYNDEFVRCSVQMGAPWSLPSCCLGNYYFVYCLGLVVILWIMVKFETISAFLAQC